MTNQHTAMILATDERELPQKERLGRKEGVIVIGNE
jgi:hypothetical protein